MKACNGKLWAVINEGVVEIRTLTADKLNEAIQVLDSFFANESVCNACEINLPESEQAREELRSLCRVTAQDGVSLIAVNSAQEVVGVAFNKLQCLSAGTESEEAFFNKFRKEQTHSPQAQALMDFMIAVDGERDVFDLYKIDCLCELMFLVTASAWERKGIGRALTAATIELARQLNDGRGLDDIPESLRPFRPKAVTALLTSIFSQKIGTALDFKVLNTVPYTRFRYNGKTFDERINPLHTHCLHVAIVI